MATLKQKTAFGPGVYRGHKLDLAMLKGYVDGTNKAIAAGIPIPLLKKHAKINASDAETEQFATSEGQGSGWLTKVDIEDGAITWEAKDVSDADVAAVAAGTLKFTSPEFRPHYVCEKAGVYEGPVIRHFAFTPLPGNPHQGAIETVALEECETAWQFDESECLPLGEDLDNATPPPPSVPDPSYENSLTTKDHVDPKENPSGTDESIDWDNLTVQEHSKILDEIHEGLSDEDLTLGEEARFNREHGGLHPQHEQFGSTGNPVSWVGNEDTWDKAKKAVGNRYGGDNNSRHWAVVTSVYKKMGGKINRGSQHEETEQFAEKLKFTPFEDSETYYSKKDGGSLAKHYARTQHGEYNIEKRGKNHRVLFEHKSSPNQWKHLGTTNNHEAAQRIAAGHHEGISSQHEETEQFAEGHSEVDNVLKSRGYEQIPIRSFSSTVGIKTYHKDKQHFVNHNGNQWTYHHISSKKKIHASTAGHDPSSLEHHLNKIHPMQHAEDNPMDEATKKKKIAEDLNAEDQSDNTEQQEQMPPKEAMQPDVNTNPDMPPKTTDRSKLAAVLAGLNQKGVVLPSDFSFENEAALDILLAALNSSIKAESEAEAEAEPGEDDQGQGNVTDAPMPFSEEDSEEESYHVVDSKHHKLLKSKGYKYVGASRDNWSHYYKHPSGKRATIEFNHSNDIHGSLHRGDKQKPDQYAEKEVVSFSEQDLAALPKRLQQSILREQKQLKQEREARIAAEAKALHFEEEREVERNDNAKLQASHKIAASKIPPSLKNILLNAYEGSIQFAEGQEGPTYTAVQVAELVEAVIPISMQFEIEDVTEAEAPKASKPNGGKDSQGNPTFTTPTTNQFFERDALPFATMHVDADRAEELVKNSPLVRSTAQQHGQPTFSPSIPSRT